MTGRTLGSYTIIERIGAGGMGEVFLAKHRRIERQAAIKLLLPSLSRDADIVNRFFNEARATSLITHPGIVQIYDCDVFDDRAYIVMEYLQGSNLNTAIVRNGAFEIPKAIWIAGQIAGALAAAHAKGIVHRDLKPENVFLAHDPLHPGGTVVKILDFGIAKLSDKNGPTSHTRTGSILGTPIYMAPEQCRGITKIDQRADIYALGCILFELLTGRPPFVKEAPGDLLIAHVSEPPPVPSSLQPAIPPELDGLILRLLAKAPDDRPPSMEAVTRELTLFHPAAADAAGPALTMRFEPAEPRAAPTQSPSAGGTRLLPSTPGSQSTLGLSASEVVTQPARRPPRRTGLWLALGGVGAAAVAVVLLRPDKTPQPPAPVASVQSRPAARPSIDIPAPPAPAAPEPSNVTVQLSSQPPGASVWIGDAAAPRGTTPVRLDLPRSNIPVRATLKADGYVDRTVALDADRDQALEVRLEAVEHTHHASSHASGPHGPGHHGAAPTHAVAAQPPTTAAPEKPPAKADPQKKYFLLGD